MHTEIEDRPSPRHPWSPAESWPEPATGPAGADGAPAAEGDLGDVAGPGRRGRLRLPRLRQRRPEPREPKARRTFPRSDSGRRLEANLLTLVAVVVAVPAFVLPAGWVVAASVVAVVLAVVDAMTERRQRTGTADVVVVPSRAIGHVALAAVNPLSWLKVLFGAFAALVIGVSISGIAAAAAWLVTEGPRGILAAVRTGIWAHGLRGAAVVVCVLLLRGVGDTFRTRAQMLRRVTSRLPETVLAGVAVVVVVGGAALGVAVPRSDLSFVRGSDGLGWVPPGLRSTVDGVRDDMVEAETTSVARCLSGDERRLWSGTYSSGNPLPAPDVARLTVDPARAPAPTMLVSAALAAHNHLASWVETIEVAIGGDVVLVVDRGGLTRRVPVTDAAVLAAHATTRPEWLATVTADERTVLRCSARTPL